MSIILAAVMMCTALASSVWAAEAAEEGSQKNAMQAEIDKEIIIAHDEIYRQLAAQDALVPEPPTTLLTEEWY